MSNPFEEVIFTALRNSYTESQTFNLYFDRNVTKITEYFITVNLCKELYEWNSKNNHQYKIEPEKRTFDIYKDCFEYYKPEDQNNIFSPTIFSSNFEEFLKNLNKIRKGKVDIALALETNGDKNISEYIFEVKAINPSIRKLKEDFLRIQEYLNASIPHFENSLKSGFIVFIKHINKEKKIQKKDELTTLKNLYINKLRDKLLKDKNNKISINILTKDIELSAYENLKINNDDYGETAYKTFISFSVIIEIERINTVTN